jgi:hypothetical protein
MANMACHPKLATTLFRTANLSSPSFAKATEGILRSSERRMVDVGGLALASRRLPPPRAGHRLAVRLAVTLAEHRYGVRAPTRAKQLAR